MNRLRYSAALLTLLTLLAPLTGGALAQTGNVSDGVVRIGLILDMSGPYSDITGEGSVVAARMAVEDFGGKVLGRPIDVVYADHQNKADISANKAREWFDQGKVDALMDVAASATALSAVEVVKQKQKIAIFNGPATTRLTNDACSPYTVHWTYDTYSLANVTGKAIVKNGGRNWYFVTADYAFGHSLEKDTADVVRADGGKVIGSTRHPLNAPDMSSSILAAQGSGAQIIGLANAGTDFINSLKAANEFGITKSRKQSLAGLLVYINDIHSLGLPTTQGLLLTEAFYWDLNDDTRRWSKRFFERVKRMPNMSQAGVYSSTMHYLRAVQAAGTDETAAVMKQMRATPVNDFFAKNGRIREDGRFLHDMYLFEVKAPEQSTSPWDYYTLRGTVPAAQAFQPIERSTCPLVAKK